MGIDTSDLDREELDYTVPESAGGPTRRELLRGSFGAALLAVIGCGKDKEEKTSAPASFEAVPVVPFSRGSVPEIEVDNSIAIPRFELSSKPVVFEKPANLAVSPQEFNKISGQVAESILQGIREYLIPILDQKPGESSKIVADFISQTAYNMERADSRIQVEMNSFLKIWDRTLESLVAHINEYLNPGGWNLVFFHEENSQLRLNCHPIIKTETMNIDDGSKAYSIPVLYLGSPLIQHPSQLSDDSTLGSMDHGFQHALVFNDLLDRAVQKLLLIRPPSPNFEQGGNAGSLRATFLQDCLQHETVHGYLARRFPRAGTVIDRSKAFYVPLNAYREKRPFVDFRGVYPPVSFQELCGVGIQIARTAGTAPDSNVAYLSSNLPETYRLMSKIFPLATLQVAPRTPLRDEIVDDLEKGAIDFDKLRKLIGTPPFTMDHARKVGEIMYRLGFKLLEQAENGQLQERAQ